MTKPMTADNSISTDSAGDRIIGKMRAPAGNWDSIGLSRAERELIVACLRSSGDAQAQEPVGTMATVEDPRSAPAGYNKGSDRGPRTFDPAQSAPDLREECANLQAMKGDLEEQLAQRAGDCGEVDQLRMQVAGTRAGRDFHIDTAAELLALLTGIIEAESESRASMGANWEGDPLSDAVDAARRFVNLEAPAVPSPPAAFPAGEIREALEPFALAAEAFDSWPKDMHSADNQNICMFIPKGGTIADGKTINYGHCRKARAALASPPHVQIAGEVWRPIETAPKDGSWIVAICNDHTQVYHVYWQADQEAWYGHRGAYGDGLFAPNGGWTPAPAPRSLTEMMMSSVTSTDREGGK